MSRRSVPHGNQCPCDVCSRWRAENKPSGLLGPPRGGHEPTPLQRAMAGMPPWHQALSYALVQFGDLMRVLAARYDPTPPTPPASEAPSEDEDEIARRAAAGDYAP